MPSNTVKCEEMMHMIIERYLIQFKSFYIYVYLFDVLLLLASLVNSKSCLQQKLMVCFEKNKLSGIAA